MTLNLPLGLSLSFDRTMAKKFHGHSTSSLVLANTRLEYNRNHTNNINYINNNYNIIKINLVLTKSRLIAIEYRIKYYLFISISISILFIFILFYS